MPEELEEVKDVRVKLPPALYFRLKRLMADLRIEDWKTMLEKCAYTMEMQLAQDENRRQGL